MSVVDKVVSCSVCHFMDDVQNQLQHCNCLPIRMPGKKCSNYKHSSCLWQERRRAVNTWQIFLNMSKRGSYSKKWIKERLNGCHQTRFFYFIGLIAWPNIFGILRKYFCVSLFTISALRWLIVMISFNLLVLQGRKTIFTRGQKWPRGSSKTLNQVLFLPFFWLRIVQEIRVVQTSNSILEEKQPMLR